MSKIINWDTLEIENVGMHHDDCCDAYALSCQYTDGIELNEDELYDLEKNDKFWGLVYDTCTDNVASYGDYLLDIHKGN